MHARGHIVLHPVGIRRTLGVSSGVDWTRREWEEGACRVAGYCSINKNDLSSRWRQCKLEVTWGPGEFAEKRCADKCGSGAMLEGDL